MQSETNKADADPSNKETRGTIPKKKGHIDHQIKEVRKQHHQKCMHSKTPIPEKKCNSKAVTPQLHLRQIRSLSLHPTTVNSKFTNSHETLF